MPGEIEKLRSRNNRRPPRLMEMPSARISLRVARPEAVKSIRVVALVLRAVTSASSSISSCAASMRARDFPVRALGPRRSHSTSRRTLLASAACCPDWASRNASRFSRKSAVTPVRAKQAVRDRRD